MIRFALACTLAIVVTSTARAQEPTADQLIEHGVALREDGRDDEALAIFHRAYDTTPSGHAMAQIALAEHALGRLVDAEAHLTQALESASDRFVRRNRALLEQALAEIRTQLTDLTVTGGVEGAEVFVDGASRGTLPLAGTIRVQAGTAHVEVRAAGYRSGTYDVTVASDTPVSLDVALEPVPSVVAIAAEPPTLPTEREPPPPLPEANAWMMPVGIALAGAGVLGIGVASGLMVLREDNAQARVTCVDSDPACRAHYGTAVDAETAGIATYVVSGLLLAGGAALIVIDLLGSSARSTAAPYDAACAPGILSLSCTMRF